MIRRVIALNSFTDKAGVFHGYGEEYDHPDNAELRDLVSKKVLRIDERVAPMPDPPKELKT